MSIAGKTRRFAISRSRTSSRLPVPLNSSKITSSIREPVLTRAVATIVREPPPSMRRAAPKNRLGFSSAFASTPPDRIFPDIGVTVLCARARRVMESRRMTTSCPDSTRRLAFSMTISATCTCRDAGSSNVELITSALGTVAMKSVTSSGRSSMSSTMSRTSGWFSAIAFAIFCRRIVLPARGGATINPRCPLPSGAIMSTTRMERSPVSVSRRMRWSGYRGRRLSKGTRFWIVSGSIPLTDSICSSARYFSQALGGRTRPRIVSPVFTLNRRICVCDT